MSALIEAELTWSAGSFVPGLRVALGESGRIEALGSAAELPGEVRSMPGRALIPGLINAHSHAFQRGLRGRGERFPAGSGSFWTWREAMYGLVAEMTPERIHGLSLTAFQEMLAAGFTSVGEFHYLHHASDAGGFELDAAVLAAAEEAGIRIVLLSAYYATGAIGRPLEGPQLRFRSADPAAYWEAFGRLSEDLQPRLQSAGCVLHSIRAASLADLASVHAESKRRGLVCHMHLEEQRQEIADCVRAYGRTPMGVLLDELELDERFSAVHCTHSEPAQMARYLAHRANAVPSPPPLPRRSHCRRNPRRLRGLRPVHPARALHPGPRLARVQGPPRGPDRRARPPPTRRAGAPSP